MSALAKYFYTLGKNIAGYDLASTSITNEMQNMGILIHFNQNISAIPEKFFNKESTLVIRTPAVPDDHKELKYFREHDYKIMKRAEVLGRIVNKKKGIAIAGTHGKTSVSSILAYIMHESEVGCTAFLGGILKNYNSNLVVGKNSSWIVSEADEFDRSFLQLRPEIALITWIDSDHLDIYSSYDEIKSSYKSFLSQVRKGGIVVLKKGIEIDFDENEVRKYTYSFDDSSADFFASDIKKTEDKYSFNIHTPGKLIRGIVFSYPGLTNIENAVAATSVAWLTGVDENTISATLGSFEGVKRRFDIQYKSDACIYIDDYAHHPRELDAFISSVRNLYPGKKITGIFQPHLYSRTRDFADEFATSLSALDKLILLDIYPAREQPISGVSSDLIYKQVDTVKLGCKKSELIKVLENNQFEILLTMGAGDIDRFIDPIKQLIRSR